MRDSAGLTSGCLGSARHLTFVCQPAPPEARTPNDPGKNRTCNLWCQTNALSIRPQGRILLATKLYGPVQGKLSSGFGGQSFLSLQGGMQDRPLQADGEEEIYLRRQALCEKNISCGQP